MTAAARRSPGSVVSTPDLRWRAVWPLVVLLVAQVGLYVWMAPRGFEFTDEAYYLLNYLYWRDLIGTVTFFGAYFELPFRLLGQSIPAIRIFSVVLLLASSAFFTREAFGHAARRVGGAGHTPWPYVVVGMAASMLYFGFMKTLRAPSYNLLVLCSMLLATGLLLRLLEPGAPKRRVRIDVFCYGLAVGACGLAKATSGALLVVCHLLFFALANRDWRSRHLLKLVTLAVAGVSLNFAMLQWALPQWLAVLREGIALVASNGHSLLNLANGLRWDIQAQAALLLPWALGAAVAFVLLVRWIGPGRRAALSAWVVALLIGCVVVLVRDGLAHLWLPLLGLAVLLLWSVPVLCRRPLRPTGGDARGFGLMILLFALPLAFSFGTNTRVLEHSQAAGVFAVVALILSLHRLARLGFLTAPAMVVCLTALCVPTLVIQARAALDVHYTYRQLSALADQTEPVQVGGAGNTLLVDPVTRDTLRSVIGAARAAGLAPGQAMLDFTGDNPGLIYALGARPLGVAWLIGGYPGSQATAARLVAQVPRQALQSAWLLSSDANPRSIKGWQEMMDARLGAGGHERVASVRIPTRYRWGASEPDTLDVQIWKPRVTGIGQGQP